MKNKANKFECGLVRRSVLTAAMATALLGTQPVHALGLGEAEVESFLNQPLKVRIPIIVENEGERESLRVDLAAAEDFRKVGLDRAALGLNLDVELLDDDGQLSVLLSSTSAVTDPFLQVLLNADWSSGRLLRQYTLFLDPPLIEKPTIQVRNEPPPAPASTSRPPPPRAASTSRPNNRGNARPAAARPSIEGQYGPVGAGETLWSIASRSNPNANEYSVNQVMLAYVRMNPDAFDGGNVNSMRRGASLQVPGSQDIAVVNAQEALRIVQQQHRDWRGDFGASSQSANSSSSSRSNRDSSRDGRLQLVPPEESSAPITNSAGMRAELARLEEELLTAKLENRDLVEQVENLREEIARLEGDGLQDRELAQFQNYLGEEQSSEGDEAYVDPFVNNGFDASVDANNPADSVAGDPLASNDTLAGGVDANGDVMAGDAMAEPMAADGAAGDLNDNTNAEPIGANTVAQDNTPPTVTIDQPPVAAQPAQAGGDDRIFSPLTLAIAAIGGLGVVFLLLMQRRRDRGTSEESPAKSRFSAKDFLDKAKKLKEKKPKKEKKEKVKSKKKSGAASLADRLIAAGKQQKAEDLDAPLAGAAAAAATMAAADSMAQDSAAPAEERPPLPPDDTPISTLADSGLNDPSPEELSAMHGGMASEPQAMAADGSATEPPPPEPKEDEIDKGLDFILDEPEPEPTVSDSAPPPLAGGASDMGDEAEELLRRLANDDGMGDLESSLEDTPAEPESESGLDFDLSGMEHLISGSAAEEAPAAAEDEEDPYAAVLRGMAADDEMERSSDMAADPLAASTSSAVSDDEFDEESFAGPDEDEVEIKLDLARAYISMGDNEAASTILDEILAEGNDSQRAEARNLLKQV